MKTTRLLLILIFLAGIAVSAQNTEKRTGLVDQYQKDYPFFAMKDTAFTRQSEFFLPAGYRVSDASTQSDFANWISNFPLWHEFKAVGQWSGGKRYEADQISRAVHLPWHRNLFIDRAIPVRILSEYIKKQNRQFEWRYLPKAGDTMTYEKYLNGKVAFDSHNALIFKKAKHREANPQEFSKFTDLCMQLTSYKSLTKNCDPVKPENIIPGDLFVAYETNGLKGITYMILYKIVSSAGENLYVVATGCDEACDFHIPLLTENRNTPWISVERIQALAPDSVSSGFFRFKGIE